MASWLVSRGPALTGRVLLWGTVYAALGTAALARAAVFNVAAGDVAGLVSAINQANGNGQADTIILAAGTYRIRTVNNNTDGPNGLPSIRSQITIQGAGATTTILTRTSTNATPLRLIHVASNGNLTLIGVTVSKGLVTAVGGGGIFNRGRLTLRRCTVKDNDACELENIDGQLMCIFGIGDGGGISSSGQLTIVDSTISGNFAGSSGGIGSSGTLTMDRSTVMENGADDISGAGVCGGLSTSGVATLTNSTVSRNGSSVFGGGICGAGTVNIRNSTIADNSVADGGGAGIAGPANIRNSIVVGNSTCSEGAPPGFCPVPDDCSEGETVSQGGNVVGAFCPSNGSGDVVVSPSDVFTKVIGGLLNNGGSTLTHNLIPGGLAVERGLSGCPTPDQRGGVRPLDGNGNGVVRCDSGAVEFDPVAWNNYPFPTQTGKFSATFDGVAHRNLMDGVMSLGRLASKSVTAMAATVRFNTAGRLDARNGGAYASNLPINYVTGQKFRFRLLVDIPAHKYSVFVKPQGLPEQTLASNYSFRTEQQAVTTLGFWTMKSFVGSHDMNNFNLGVLGTPAFQSFGISFEDGKFRATFNAIPHQSAMNGVTGFAGRTVTNVSHLATIVRFNPSGRIDVRNGGVYAADRVFPYIAGTRYQFRMEVDVPNRRYSVFVRPEGGTEVSLATNFAFRTEQQGIPAFTNWALGEFTGTHTVESVEVTTLPSF